MGSVLYARIIGTVCMFLHRPCPMAVLVYLDVSGRGHWVKGTLEWKGDWIVEVSNLHPLIIAKSTTSAWFPSPYTYHCSRCRSPTPLGGHQ